MTEQEQSTPATAPVRVYLVDDHSMFRAGVRAELDTVTDAVEVVGEAGSVGEAVAGIAHHRPDVVLLDVHMPDGGGEKLRQQGSVCKRVRVSIRTGMFNPDEPKFARGVLCELPHPSDDTRLITQAALAGLEQIYRPGYSYAKAQVLLLDLYQRGEFTDDLFAATPPAAAEKVMAVLDAVNAKGGRGTLRPGIVPVAPEWGMKRGMLSQSYTTRLDQLWQVQAK